MGKIVKKGGKKRSHAVQNRTPEKRRQAVWEKAFLTALSETSNISNAVHCAGVGRQTVYDLRTAAPDFAQAWDDALEQACDKLELEARRRAHDGVTKTIFYKGEPIGEEINYSDTLMIFLLKAHRPEKYRERHEFTGAEGEPLMKPIAEAMEKIYGGGTKDN